MGCIFRPEALSWEDIDGGRGEMTMEAIRNFISEYCYPDEYADYGDDRRASMGTSFATRKLQPAAMPEYPKHCAG